MFTTKALKPIDFTDDKKVVHPLRVGDLLTLDDSYRNHWYIVDLLNTGGIELVVEEKSEPVQVVLGDVDFSEANYKNPVLDKQKPSKRGKDGRKNP